MATLSLLALLILLIPVILLAVLWFIVQPRSVKVPINGRHVFITGGSSGIGLALAHAAAKEGARVSILARNQEKLERARQEILESTGQQISIFSADVRDFEQVKEALGEAGPVDVLICNHGVYTPQELELQPLATMQAMMDINFMGTVHLIKAALPRMKDRTDGVPCSIALMSSQAGQVGVYGYTAYSASKFALRGLAEALQQEVIPHNIRVSLIFPPDTDTPGLVEENKMRPEITKLIAASSSSMDAKEVAEITLNGIKSGKFMITCNFDGFMLSIATAGMSPQPSATMAFLEVVAAGLMRIVALCILWGWYSTVQRWHNNQRKFP
ncbi:3-dehydrosphinganine reductase TSC10A isoform X3 [Cryptomeria japonica]|uniref:3-dehydrosphinganine reductase TSC10A isoform X3 n=1 Tax=Cryptomeria japonica TaxID=3369 RepID=UPI0025AC1C2D|nr:3-dehydrosphinganine reductase TSC10A isoform X3 [Cryptomeria japonica]